MSKTLQAGLAAALLFTSGCASYARFTPDSSASAEDLLREFGVADEHVIIGVDKLRGNTLRSELKTLITDKSINKRYFGTAGRMFYQDEPMVAYGILQLPTHDKDSQGYVVGYRAVRGVIVTDLCEDGGERLVVTRPKVGGEYACWLQSSCVNTTPFASNKNSWMKWDCTIESGRTLRVEGR